MHCRLGQRPWPHWRSLSATPDPLVEFQGQEGIGREWMEGEGRAWEGRMVKGRRGEWKGKGENGRGEGKGRHPPASWNAGSATEQPSTGHCRRPVSAVLCCSLLITLQTLCRKLIYRSIRQRFWQDCKNCFILIGCHWKICFGTRNCLDIIHFHNFPLAVLVNYQHFRYWYPLNFAFSFTSWKSCNEVHAAIKGSTVYTRLSCMQITSMHNDALR